MTGLTFAANCGHLDIVKYLVENGANIDAKAPFNDDTPLFRACVEGHPLIVDYLASCNANVNAMTTHSLEFSDTKSPAAFEAIGHKHAECVEILAYYGANLYLGPKNSSGRVISVIEYCKLEDNYGIVEIEHGLKKRYQMIKEHLKKWIDDDQIGLISDILSQYLNFLSDEYLDSIHDYLQ